MVHARLQGLRRIPELITIVVLLLPAAACGGSDEGRALDAHQAEVSDISSPFTVGAVPAG